MSDRENLKRALSSLAVKRRCACSDETTACERFFRTHDPMIQDVVKKYASHRAGFDDLIQEVRRILVRDLPDFHDDPARGSVRGWVATVAHHAAAREAHRLSRHPAEDLTPELAEALLDPGPGPATLLERGQDLQQLEAFVFDLGEGLSTLNRRIIVMHWNERRSVLAIAAEVKLSEHAVEARLRRARVKLKDKLHRAGWDLHQENLRQNFGFCDRVHGLDDHLSLGR